MATKIFLLLLILVAVGKTNARYAWNLGQLYQGIQTKDDCKKCVDQCKYDLHPFKTILLVELILFVQLDVFYFFVGTGRTFCCFGFTRVNPNFGQRQFNQDIQSQGGRNQIFYAGPPVQSRGFSDYWCKKCVDTCKYTTIVFPICYGACIAVLMNSDTPWSFCET